MDHRIGGRAKPTEAAYSPAEFDLIRKTARDLLVAAEERLSRGRRLEEELKDSSNHHERALSELLKLVRTDGAFVGKRSAEFLWWLRTHHGLKSGVSIARLVYLRPVEAFAASVLLIANEGFNESVLTDLRLSASQPSAPSSPLQIYRLESRKPRRGPGRASMSFNFIDAGAGSTGHLITRILALTSCNRDLLRKAGMPSDNLILSLPWDHCKKGDWKGKLRSTFATNISIAKVAFGKIANVRSDEGRLIPVSFRRLRRSQQVRSRKPAQNSQATHDNIYVLRDKQVRDASIAVTEQGLSDALSHAVRQMAIKWEASVDREDKRDGTVIAECTDFNAGPYSTVGEPCSASFLLCLACKNARASRRNLPRLTTLQDALLQHRSTVSADSWRTLWQPHFDRLNALLRENTTEAERKLARESSTDRDRQLIDELLRGELDVI